MTTLCERDIREAEEALNFLASMPSGKIAVTLRVLRTIMLQTDGQIMAGGHLYEIKSSPLAGGVYRLRLERWREQP